MAGKRARTAVAASKSSLEESADALAGVEGALLTGSKRKGTPSPKKIKQEEEDQESAWTSDQVAIAAAAAAAAAASVPDPMASDAMENDDEASASALVVVMPTGFKKKSAAKKTTTATAKAAASSTDESDGNNKSRKVQVTYNPEISMTKEQLTAWRREQRRVRNRESAAASRRKVRDRIGELEDEVEIWKRRYQEVMARLGQSDGERMEEERQIRMEVDSEETAADGQV